MVRNVPAVVEKGAGNVKLTIVPGQQREYLGSSVSIYSHFKLKFEIVDPKRSRFRAKLIQPPKQNAAEFSISRLGIVDI
jgi:hypothetical protein